MHPIVRIMNNIAASGWYFHSYIQDDKNHYYEWRFVMNVNDLEVEHPISFNGPMVEIFLVRGEVFFNQTMADYLHCSIRYRTMKLFMPFMKEVDKNAVTVCEYFK